MLRLALVFSLLATLVSAADDPLVGHWSGAYVRGGAALSVTLDIAPSDAGWLALPTIRDWPGVEFRARAVTRDDDGRVRLDMPFGAATLVLDAERRELVGNVVNDDGETMALHFVRALRPPPSTVTLEEHAIAGPVGTLAATVVLPGRRTTPLATLVWVHGRGCWDGARASFVVSARRLAEYGVASVVYDKRGCGASAGSCDDATLDNLSRDLLAVIKHTRALPEIGDSLVGTISSSAGGWVSWRATELLDDPVTFVITHVGPSTSVEQQQRDNMRLTCDAVGVPDAARADAARYLDLMFDVTASPEETHAEMSELLVRARRDGWIEFHDTTDIAKTVNDVAGLWVRRHAYDPAAAISSWERPTLALYGGADSVVPGAENAAIFAALTADNPDASARVLPGASHGLWLSEDDVEGTRVFARKAHGALEDVLDFLERLGDG